MEHVGLVPIPTQCRTVKGCARRRRPSQQVILQCDGESHWVGGGHGFPHHQGLSKGEIVVLVVVSTDGQQVVSAHLHHLALPYVREDIDLRLQFGLLEQ